MKYINLYTNAESVEYSRRMGWDGVCAAGEYNGNSGFRKFVEEVRSLGDDVSAGAVVSGDMRKNARKALDAGADLVFADGRGVEDSRRASECWEVDFIVNPEVNDGRDGINQWNSGLDHVTVSFIAERGIGYCVNTDNILHARGVKRARLFGRVMQNIRLCRKYGVRVVFSSGARSKWGVRNPHDLILLARSLGVSVGGARDTVSKNPAYFVKKAADRNSPDVIMKGVEVLDWSSQERKPKRKYGWY